MNTNKSLNKIAFIGMQGGFHHKMSFPAGMQEGFQYKISAPAGKQRGLLA